MTATSSQKFTAVIMTAFPWALATLSVYEILRTVACLEWIAPEGAIHALLCAYPSWSFVRPDGLLVMGIGVIPAFLVGLLLPWSARTLGRYVTIAWVVALSTLALRLVLDLVIPGAKEL